MTRVSPHRFRRGAGALLSRAAPALLVAALGCGAGEPPAQVPTAQAELGRIERIVVATGTIEPVKEVEVRPRIPGIIEHIRVEDDDVVEEGQLLVEIERDLLESQAAEAKATLDEARVQQRFARSELARARKLVESGARSPQHLEDMQARSDQAEARTARAEAALRTISTQLSYSRVVSPLAGRVREIAPLGERIQNVTYFRVEIQVTDADAGSLRPRMFGDADIVTEVVEDALLVPETALHYRGDEVFVRSPNGDAPAEERSVRIGIVDGNRVQVLEGRAAGDVVVLQ